MINVKKEDIKTPTGPIDALSGTGSVIFDFNQMPVAEGVLRAQIKEISYDNLPPVFKYPLDTFDPSQKELFKDINIEKKMAKLDQFRTIFVDVLRHMKPEKDFKVAYIMQAKNPLGKSPTASIEARNKAAFFEYSFAFCDNDHLTVNEETGEKVLDTLKARLHNGVIPLRSHLLKEYDPAIDVMCQVIANEYPEYSVAAYIARHNTNARIQNHIFDKLIDHALVHCDDINSPVGQALMKDIARRKEREKKVTQQAKTKKEQSNP